jgi:hypothetical protein
MKIKDALGPLRHAVQVSPVPVSPESTAERVMRALPVPVRALPVPASAARVVKSGVAAGATVVALSAASAFTSALRRRQERS